ATRTASRCRRPACPSTGRRPSATSPSRSWSGSPPATTRTWWTWRPSTTSGRGTTSATSSTSAWTWCSTAWSGTAHAEDEHAGRGGVSVLRELGEGLLRVAVPAHRRDRVLPAALHVLVRRLVGRVATLDGFLEVPVLSLDDV